jgi:hypothetical protein
VGIFYGGYEMLGKIKEKKIINVLLLITIALVLYYLSFFIKLYVFNYRFIEENKNFSLVENSSIDRINHAKSINFYLENFKVFGCHYCSYNNYLIGYKFNKLINNATDSLEVSLLELESKKYRESRKNSNYNTKKYDELVYKVLDENLYNYNVNKVYIAYMVSSISLYLNHLLNNKDNISSIELTDKLNRLIDILNKNKKDIKYLDILRYKLNENLNYYVKNNDDDNDEIIKIIKKLEDF